MAVVTIVGAGMMGTAMCWPVADRGHEVRLVGTPLDEEEIQNIRLCRVHSRLERAIPPGVQEFLVDDLPGAVKGADLIIGGISSFGIDWFAQAVGPYLHPAAPVLLVTKGLEDRPNGDLEVLPLALDHRLPEHLRGRVSINAIGGPCIAHELAARRQTAVVFTGKEEAVLRRLREMLSTPYYHAWTSSDLVGVETCAAMKNAYALGVGLAVGMMEAAGPDGLANMYNPQAALFGQSCYEMRRLVRLLGGDDGNVTWLPGPGDLYVTVFGGRTVRLGKMLGQGLPFREARKILAGVTLESVEIATRVARALPKLAARGLVDLADFPLLLHIDQIINADAPVDIPWEAFFRQPYIGDL
jgi:glycerol-3-phosphate dehydrogenase (NAD(P)+)